MSRSAKILALALVSALGLGALSRARAQEPEANGPAGATAVDPSTQEAPDDPTHAALRRSLAGPGELVQSEATPTIPAGSIRVTVVGPGGSPIEGAPIRIGVMAQEVLREYPGAVVTLPDGMYAVNYGRIAW